MELNKDFSEFSMMQDIGRWHVTQFLRRIAQTLQPDILVLDMGAGECAYKKFFSHCRYKAVDLAVGDNEWNYNNLNVIAELHNLPFAASSADAILCTQALEHLEWPRESVKEFYRILKPSGRLYMTVPMSHCEHQAPYDFFRYTSFGIKSILVHAGFDERNIKITPFGGTSLRIASELPRIKGLIWKNGGKKSLFSFPARLLLNASIKTVQLLLMTLDRLDLVKNDPFGWSVETWK
ncbi:MAG: class I SAM-dependent methyltransferase [Deltaproteobacteria bacterium]|nr:class I SAM-dependent methyltransferase [Deltaproteobacteria bacterium]